MTLILAWSPEEAGKIIEAYKIYENKPADKLMGKTESSSYIRVICLLKLYEYLCIINDLFADNTSTNIN